MLRALAASGPGTLGVEDDLGRRAAFAAERLHGAVAQVRAFRFVEVRLDFSCPEAPADAAWGAIPAAPGAYAGTSTAQDYAAGGVALGVGGTMRIEMSRQFPVRPLPRARGARACGPQSGAHLRLIVSAHLLAAADNLAAALQDLAALHRRRPRRADRQRQHLRGRAPGDRAAEARRPRAHRFEAEFIQQI